MNRIIAFVIVAVIGYVIMITDKSKPECFLWCDVGKALLMWTISEATMHLVKGPSMGVRMVGGGIEEWDEGAVLGGSIFSHVVKK